MMGGCSIPGNLVHPSGGHEPSDKAHMQGIWNQHNEEDIAGMSNRSVYVLRHARVFLYQYNDTENLHPGAKYTIYNLKFESKSERSLCNK
eukprot:1162114-Pelagomonas_calceolata.AAC.3